MIEIDPKSIPFLIDEELYLLKSEQSDQPPAAAPSSGLVVVDSKEALEKASQGDSFLAKVLGAVDVKLEAVEIRTNESFKPKLLDKHRWALFFGMESELETKVNPYELRTDPCLHMVVDQIGEIEADRSKKAKLWGGLQVMFKKD